MNTIKQVDWKKALISVIEKSVFPAPSSDMLFNQYLVEDARYDQPGASAVRRDNLRLYINSFADKPEILMIAEAPGPWGCRFSGVPITSEEQLLDPDFPISGAQSSKASEPYKEYSAGIFWRMLRDYHDQFFVWNSVPFHPRKPGQPASIRTPRASELQEYAPILSEICNVLNPTTIVSIGRKAEKTLKTLGFASTYVRHPSQGGSSYFAKGMKEVFGTLGMKQ